VVVEEQIERCEVCGFAWDAVPGGEVPARVSAAAASIAALIRPGGAAVVERPEPGTWSVLEYGCHVRDVLYNLRDRIVVGLAEDNPVPKAMFADVRLAHGLYAGDDPATLATEIELAGGLFARTISALDADTLARPIFYGWPTPGTRTLEWVAAQALHEAEHHLGDVERIVAP
jgi:DinB superfamily